MDIEQRFAHLERSNRRLRTGLLSLTIAITTVLIVGQAKPEKVPGKVPYIAQIHTANPACHTSVSAHTLKRGH